MSATSLFATKKRDLSVLYGTSCVYPICPLTSIQSAYIPSNDQEGYPPSKRHRSSTTSGTKAMDDVFGDHEDFTADDLEEIEILASQAYTQDTHSGVKHSNHNQGNVRQGNVRSNNRMAPPFPQPQRPERSSDFHSNSAFGLDGLQSPHEVLNRKLKVLEEEVLVKNGEIKVLRDALRQTETSLEQQKIAQVQLEKEKAQLLCEKEKELLKKVQSLQSELQFKDAEMNELKSKLQSSERKASAAPVSPKKSPSKAKESCPSPLPGKSTFPTKESFRANTNIKPHQSTCVPCTKPEPEVQHVAVKQAKLFSRSSHVQQINSQGSVLINSLMQLSSHGSPLGLCHLLSGGLDALPGSPARRGHSSNTSEKSISSTLSATQHLTLKDAQKLAITGLNSIALDATFVGEKSGSQNQKGLRHLNRMSRIPGAVLLLPLVEFHIMNYCQALQLLEKSGVSPSNNQSLSSSSTDGTVISTVEDTISSLREPALASLGILYYLVFYSLEVVETLLQSGSEKRTQMAVDQMPSTSRCAANDSDEQALHPLFKNMVSLLSSTVVTCKRDLFQEQALCVLVKLAENSPKKLLCRFQGLFTSPVLFQCLSADSSLPIALNVVRLLALLADHQSLAAFFCSATESCILLALCMRIISRPEKRTESLWLQFEHEVVRLLNKLITQGWNSPSSESGMPCQCAREVVKALVLTLHQEWLFVRRSTLLFPTPAQNKSVQLLRETVMLLYSYFQKDKNFSEHCLEVLHQYDQAVPGVRAILRKYNILKESEEFALDELCPPEVEAEDENMDCT